MARFTVVNSSELRKSEDNPTGCWSPERYLGRCQNCDIFRRALERSNTLSETLKRLKCKPKLNAEQRKVIQAYMETKREHIKSLEAMKKSMGKFNDAGINPSKKHK